MPNRNVYLHDIPLEEAQALFQHMLQETGWGTPLPGEEIPLEQALGRVTAEPVWARLSSPHYHAAAMDGYAVRSTQTEGASATSPIALQLESQARGVDTGDALPLGFDAVVPIEATQPIPGKDGPSAQIEIRSAIAPWANVRSLGEDIVATELVLPAGQTLRPVDLGAIAASGHATAVVRRQPRVAVIPTGSELVPLGTPPRPGQVLEFNSIVLAAQVQSWGGLCDRFEIVRDELEAIRGAVGKAAEDHDLILLNAGSSAGREDYSAQTIESLGEVLVHGIAVRPGHPVILGRVRVPNRAATSSREVRAEVPVIGVPGFAASAALTGEIFVRPLLDQWLGRAPADAPTVEAVLTRKVASPLGDTEFLRVSVGRVGEKVVAAPLSRGAGVISSLVRADGIVQIPRYVQGYAAGERVTVHLYRSPAEIERTIVAIGSHDLTLDLLGQFLARHGFRLTSANAGSLGGLLALRRGEAHVAGSHLLDPDTGEYNLSYIRQYLPETPVAVLGFVDREQGLMVASGNPKAIRSFQDLVRPEVVFVNRQRGAGTRVLLDYYLNRGGIEADRIHGYEREEYTHLAVAAQVASGAADCALGIRAAALALGLDFIPVAREQYDLVVPIDQLESAKLRTLREVLADPEFQAAVMRLPGYEISRMGTLIAKTG
ncbi:MAG: molybdopterin biosynthesis protein [Anaerolineales bacterium]|jgi:putative molybdopterin biosynthesis protein